MHSARQKLKVGWREHEDRNEKEKEGIEQKDGENEI